MEIFKTKTELTTYLNTFHSEKSVGFTPTMGALHSGHLQLIESSKIECDITICSIFVNPTQFNNSGDLEKYPNTLKADLEKLKQVNCDIVYTPTIDDLYAKGEKAKEFNFGSLAASMEGKFRSGHFNGMATIVEKFFNIINPTKAFFGQKDLQQLQIVKALVKQMHSDIEIIGIPIIRDESGLAKSSRNSLLSANAKTEALLISKCLNFCTENKRLGISELQKYIKSAFEKSRNLELEYAEFVSLKQMKEIKEWEAENQSAVCIAAYIDGVRLIDNIIL
ncbi:pantoate--beta-alanine ligase [Flavobacteriales bacterium]|nr:pantoate--beta-alanine ligase [Flavobacteriales bacterium]